MDILNKLKDKAKVLKRMQSKPKTAVSILVAILCLGIGFGAKHFTGKNDSPPEQLAEYVIEQVFDIDIDFTEGEPEEIKAEAKAKDVD